MRFGKRNKAKLIPLRRDVTERNEIVRFPLPEDEGVLPVDPTPDVTVRSAADVETGDNTQRLLTALGRFHRYVAKGQSGAPQGFWSDDCMTQLISALELASTEGWMNVIEALTGTARILQSYENGQSANLAIPFLNDSYEMLCLMVGDLIVKNERSGVMGRWRTRYDKAVTDLDACGFALVEDEAPEPVVEIGPEVMDAYYPEIVPVEPDVAPAEAHEDFIAPFVPAEVPAEEPVAEYADEPAVDELLPFLMPEETDGHDWSGSAPLSPLERIVESQAKREGALSPSDKDDAAEDVLAPVAEPPVAPGKEPEVVQALDLLCEQLSRISNAVDEDRQAHISDIIDNVVFLRNHARDNDRQDCVHVCDRMVDACELITQGQQAPEEGFLDIGYAFCETYVQSITDSEDSAVASWLSDVEDYCQKAQTAPIVTDDITPFVTVEAPAEIEVAPTESPKPVTAKSGTAESLLETAQQAIAHGDVSSAKTLALQAVAELARREADKAEQRVREAELRFRENAESIERERESVRQAEQSVTDAESRVRESLDQLDAQQASTAGVIELAAAIERRIEDIDKQLRVLQLAREEELARAGEIQAELTQAREEEKQYETELDASREAEAAARAFLENARQTVKTLQRKQIEIEETLGRAHESLVHYQSSLSDIDRTIHQLQPKADGANPGATDMLF